ncbi:MAG TPA: DUF4363 family protein [Bacillales bacterium]|nr:DUF4363 family protein [Bacillales bacterium]
MKRLLGAIMIAVFIAGGWPSLEHAQMGREQAQAGEVFHQLIQQINQMITKENWQGALKKTSELRATFQKKQWKLQLLGDEGEYEGLNRELDQLYAAVKAKDKSESKVELAAVASYIKSIYSL